MPTIPEVNVAAIRDRVGEQSYARGREYFKAGAIRDPRRQGMTLKAGCEGSRPSPYRVEVTFGRGGIAAAECSCPVGEGGYCKHVAALLLTWEATPEAFVEVEELDASLAGRSHAELVALVKQMLRLHPDLERVLETPLPGPTPRRTPVDAEAYRRRAGAAFHRYGPYDEYGDEGAVAGELQVLVEIGDGFREAADVASAVTVYGAVVSATVEHYGEVADEEGDVAQVLGACAEGLGACLADAGADGTPREQVLRTLFDLYRFDVDLGGVGLSDAVPELLVQHATPAERRVVAGWVREVLPAGGERGEGGGQDFSTTWRRETFGGLLLKLEEDTLDDETFLRICRETGRTGDVVERLLSLGRADEARREVAQTSDYALLDLVDVFSRHGQGELAERLIRQRLPRTQDARLLEWLKTRATERGDTAGALELALQLLHAWPSFQRYVEVRGLAQQAGRWEALRPELLQLLRRSPDSGILVRVYLDEGEIEQALSLVGHDSEGAGPYRYGYGHDPQHSPPLLVARAAEESHPREALEIYRRHAERIAEQRARADYGLACRFLERVRALYTRLGEAEAWERYIAGFRDRTRTLRALKAELADAGL